MPMLPVEELPQYVVLTDLTVQRLEVISFFLLLFLLSAALVRWIWNSIRSDFPRWPYLSYAKSVAIVGLWGTAFLLVLTMISGARELMTPGAWKKNGTTYQLAEPVHQAEQTDLQSSTVDARLEELP